MKCQGCLEDKELVVTDELNGSTIGFCRRCVKELFDGKKISPLLQFNSPYKEPTELFNDLTRKISISGVQIKYSMRMEDGKLVLTDKGGQYIIKPIPIGQYKNLDQAPANEHLTMQIAHKYFKISVPSNALVYFQDGTPAYLVRRFDVKPDGSKYLQEDFAQVAQITSETNGVNYKYDLSYEEIGALIRKYVATYPIELEKFFRLLIFNYIFSNGDAHAKNFSVMRTEAGDHVLTPAYDLLCTRIHSPSESDMALMLFKDRFSEAFDAHGFYTLYDFELFGKAIGIRDVRVAKIINEFRNLDNEIMSHIDASFLRDGIKEIYKAYFIKKRKTLDIKWIQKEA